MKIRGTACLLLLALAVAGCGSSASSSNSGINAGTSVSSTSVQPTNQGSSCPFTSAQVASILGVQINQLPGAPTPQGTCTFGTAINGGVDIDLTKPGLSVYPYPQPGQPSTLAALHRHLIEVGDHGVVDHPEWGSGAFADIAETSVLQIDVFVSSVHVLAFLPKPFSGDPKAIANGIGHLLAGS
jgi:hypothetical protein